jgi:anti-sigma regulatory factor (Ser/Thr protein kinase)
MKVTERSSFEPVVSDVERLNHWLDAAFVKAGTDLQLAQNLKLCINEAVANLISYAFENTTLPCLVVELELDDKTAKAIVLDNGRHFDFRRWPEPERPTSLAATNPGGFGISLMRERASRLTYEIAGGMNKLTIECFRQPLN